MSTNGSSTRIDNSTDSSHNNDLDTKIINSTNIWISDNTTSNSDISSIDYHPAGVRGSHPLGIQQSPSLPMVIQITDDEDDDSLAPLNNKTNSLIHHEPIINYNFDQPIPSNISITNTQHNNSSGAATTSMTWIDRYFTFMGPHQPSNNNNPNMNSNSIYYSPTNEKNSSKSEVLYAMLVATIVAVGAVFYSAWITSPHTSVGASFGTNSNDDNSSRTSIGHNNSGSSCDYVNNTTLTSSMESMFTTIATGFIASIIAVTFFSKMKISLTFDSSHQHITPSLTDVSNSIGGSATIASNATKSVLEIQASLLRLFHAMIAALIVSILTYIVMNYNHTIIGKVITALYLLFLGM